MGLGGAIWDLDDRASGRRQHFVSIMAQCLPDELSNMSPLQKLGVGMKILVRKPILLTKRVISVLLSFGYSRAKHFGW